MATSDLNSAVLAPGAARMGWRHAVAGVLHTDAFDELYDETWLSMVRLATVLLGDRSAAEDAVQDAFVRVHGRWNYMTSVAGARAYLRAAVVNSARSALRRRAVAKRALVAMAAEPTTVVSGDEPGGHQDVLDALRTLPRRQREVLTLRYLMGMSETEIAETLSISRGSVKSAGSRGMSKLRLRLEET